jgi:hypothetical protein
MTAQAWAEDVGREDRIDVTDDAGQQLGWVDPITGSRTLVQPDRGDVFDEVVDFWLVAAGLAPETEPRRTTEPEAEPLAWTVPGRVTEVRYPDPETIRTLVIPLIRAD